LACLDSEINFKLELVSIAFFGRLFSFGSFLGLGGFRILYPWRGSAFSRQGGFGLAAFARVSDTRPSAAGVSVADGAGSCSPHAA